LYIDTYSICLPRWLKPCHYISSLSQNHLHVSFQIACRKNKIFPFALTRSLVHIFRLFLYILITFLHLKLSVVGLHSLLLTGIVLSFK
jgi:hypothetical protein